MWYQQVSGKKEHGCSSRRSEFNLSFVNQVCLGLGNIEELDDFRSVICDVPAFQPID